MAINVDSCVIYFIFNQKNMPKCALVYLNDEAYPRSSLIGLYNCKAEVIGRIACRCIVGVTISTKFIDVHRCFKICSKDARKTQSSTLTTAWISATSTHVYIIRRNVSRAGFPSHMKTPSNETRAYCIQIKKEISQLKSIASTIKSDGHPIETMSRRPWQGRNKNFQRSYPHWNFR